MNIEAYNLDSLRKLVRALQAENKELRELLEKAEIPYSNSEVFTDTPIRKEEFDLDQGGRITQQFIDKKLAVRFFSMFWGREDVFAKRAKNGNYYPQCDNRWNNALCPKQKGEKNYCGNCENACWTELTPEILVNHLLGYREDGVDVIGVYPLLVDGTCRFLVFDFDNHEKDAAETDFANEDELWHDEVDALRLICKQNGIDALVERSRSGKGAHVWIFFQKPIPASLARNFGFLLLDKGATTINLKSFKYYDRMYPSQDVTDSIGNLIALPNQIRCMATFDNPVFYKNKRLGYSNYYNFSTVYMGTDVDGYVKIPRGLLEELLGKCKDAGIEYEIEDQREKGRPIRVSFQGELRMQQNLSAQRLLSYENGILSAATAFGKTVVCSYLIAQKKVNTLISLESTDLISQWEDELNNFLRIDEELPEYKTKTGRVKKRESVIGTLKSGRDTLAGIVDIAMIGSLYKKGKFHERLNDYGMVIMDECHHGASATAQEILKQVNAKYVYGVSATPMRSDKLEKINYMLLGPIRHQYTALERNEAQGIDHLVIPRYTRVANTAANKDDINEAYALVSGSKLRNEQIIEDIKECVEKGRTPVILTKYKEHAKYIYDYVQGVADFTFILYGDNSGKENESIRRQMKEIPRDKSFILVATGQKIGEGFDCPRLDTLMLVSPVSFAGRLEQYVGRVNRDYEGKKDVIVYDYIDSHISKFENMYLKRLRTYKKIGFKVVSNTVENKQDVNAIYDSGNYMEVFERDLIEAEKEIVISSPHIIREKILRFISIVKARQESGVKITVITETPERTMFGNTAFLYALIRQMQDVGIRVEISEEEIEHFAVIDHSLAWHGGMNLLGKEDAWDNLIRVRDEKAAAELLAMAFEG